MHFSKLILTILPFAIAASALVVRDSAASSACDVVQTSSFEVNGKTITRTTLACPETDTTTPALKERSLIDTIQARSSTECTNSFECACGEAQTLVCTNQTATSPNPSDCTVLIEAIPIIEQEEGATYFVNAGLTDTISFDSCTSAVTNKNHGTSEFCWDERATAISLINQECFEQSAGTTGSFVASKYTSEVIKAGP